MDNHKQNDPNLDHLERVTGNGAEDSFGVVGDYARRQDDVRIAESLYAMFLQFETAVQIVANDVADPDDLDDADHELIAIRAARRAIRAAVRLRQAGEAHVNGVGYSERRSQRDNTTQQSPAVE